MHEGAFPLSPYYLLIMISVSFQCLTSPSSFLCWPRRLDVWYAGLSGNQNKDAKSLVHRDGWKFNLFLMPRQGSEQNCPVDSENVTFLFWDAVLISSPVLRPTVAPTLGMGVKRGNRKSHTEPPVWSCILLPLWEIVCNQELGLCKARIRLEHDSSWGLCPRVEITGCSTQHRSGTGSCHWSSPHLERHFPLSHCDILLLPLPPRTKITQTCAQSISQTVTCSCHSKRAANTISMPLVTMPLVTAWPVSKQKDRPRCLVAV